MKVELIRVETSPQVKAAGVVFFCRKTGRILLAYRSAKVRVPHTWGQWGGCMEPGETPFTCALRESKEESGYDLTMDMVLASIAEIPTVLYYTYLSLVEEEFTPLLNWENENFVWCQPQDIPEPTSKVLEISLTGIYRALGDCL